MAEHITRRDFLNGVALGVGASLLTPADLLARAGPSLTSPMAVPSKSSLYFDSLTLPRAWHTACS